MQRLDYIPFNKIDKIEIYQNTSKLTLKQIVTKKNPDYAITGTFYNTSWKPTCQVKIDGKVIVDDGYGYYGFRWNTPSDFAMSKVPAESKGFKNHIANCYLIVNGDKIPKPNYNADVKGTRGRAAIGIKGNQLVLYASKDGTSDAKTPEALRDYLFNKGVTSLIMCDGGGKVNYYAQGSYMQGSAKSQNLVLVYLKKEVNNNPEPEQPSEPPKTANELTVTKRIMVNNPRVKKNNVVNKTGYVQHSTGTPGIMAEAIIASFNKSTAQAEAHMVIDNTGIYQTMPLNIQAFHAGGTANSTCVGVEVCEPLETRMLSACWKNLSQGGKYNDKWVVKRVQQELVARGYNTNGVDGLFGSGTTKAVKAFQADNKLTADGIIGKGTLKVLQNRQGSYVKYDASANKAYFENVYAKAVYACAYVLKQIGVSNVTYNTVMSHAEAYQKGIGSNHADVGHWWPEHGKTMDNFRADVIKYMETGILPYGEGEQGGQSENSTPTEVDVAWDKACDKGVFDGSNPEGPVSRRQLAVVLYRLNLL